MSRQANKTLHITEKTWELLWSLFTIKCTNDEAIASLLWFLQSLNYTDKDVSELVINYREYLNQQQREMIMAQ